MSLGPLTSVPTWCCQQHPDLVWLEPVTVILKLLRGSVCSWASNAYPTAFKADLILRGIWFGLKQEALWSKCNRGFWWAGGKREVGVQWVQTLLGMIRCSGDGW